MNHIKHFIVIFIAYLLTSCSMVSDPVKKIGLGGRVVNYQADGTVDSVGTKANRSDDFVFNFREYSRG